MNLDILGKSFGKKNYTYNTSFNIIPKKRLLSVRDDVVKDVEKNFTFMVIKTTKVFLSLKFSIFGHWQQ